MFFSPTGILILFPSIAAHLSKYAHTLIYTLQCKTNILFMCNVVASQPFPTVPRYHLIDRALTWPEARSFCMLKYTDLATVNNMFNKNRLVNVVGNRVAFAWIGLYNAGNKRWMWSDGDGRAFFTGWKGGEPNNLYGDEWCGEMSEKGEWNDKSCGDEKAFVCYQREYGTQRDNVNVLSSTWIYSSYQFCFALSSSPCWFSQVSRMAGTVTRITQRKRAGTTVKSTAEADTPIWPL